GEISAISLIYVHHERRVGRLKSLPSGGDRRSVLKPVRDWLLRLIGKEPDLTLMAVCRRLMKEQDVKADPSMLCRFFQAEKISFKKNRARIRAAQARRGARAAKLA